LSFISFSLNGTSIARAARSPESERLPTALYVADVADVANAVDDEGSTVCATMVEPALNAIRDILKSLTFGADEKYALAPEHIDTGVAKLYTSERNQTAAQEREGKRYKIQDK